MPVLGRSGDFVPGLLGRLLFYLAVVALFLAQLFIITGVDWEEGAHLDISSRNMRLILQIYLAVGLMWAAIIVFLGLLPGL